MTGIINHLWQSTLFAIAVAILAQVLRNNQARTRYWLWIAASAKFLLPFSLLIALGSRVEVPRTPITGVAAEQIITSFSPAPLIAIPVQHASTPWWPKVLAAVWIIGAILLLARWLRNWLSIRAALRGAIRLPVATPIPVLSTNTAIEPGVFGIFRPVLLLPEGIIHRLSTEELDAVMAHELSHVRRRDNLTAALHMVVETFFWFHPLVWWIGARLVEEREFACDEAVLHDGKQPEIYAQCILTVCKFYLASPLPCASGVSGADLRKRITAIMKGTLPAQLSTMRKSMLACAGLVAIAAPLAVGILAGQSESASLEYKYEVASIRPNTSQSSNSHSNTSDRGLRATNVTLMDLIVNAYDVRQFQISGGAAWIKTDRFDITAKNDSALDELINPSDQGQRAKRSMRERSRMRNLLADRFQLKLREETKELPIYALIIDKGGHKMKLSTNGKGGMNMNSNNGNGTLRGDGILVKNLAATLSNLVGRPVIDETGLSELFDFEMNWSDDRVQDASNPSIFTAVREQLGLKLESKKGPVVTYVIERAEKPSEN